MNDNAKRWLEALRSGKYSQTRRSLRTDHGFCCLGVACDVYDPKGWEKDTEDISHEFMGERNYLPKEVREWLGLRPHYSMAHGGVESILADLNDKTGSTFAEIADYLEKHPEIFTEVSDV